MLTKRSVSSEELISGKIVFLTRNFSTYRVRYVKNDDNTSRVYVEIVSLVITHKEAAERMGKNPARWVLRSGDIVRLYPERLFLVENKRDPFWKRIANLLRKKKND